MTSLIFFYFSEKISIDISCELSAKQMIHMKCHNLFSLKTTRKKMMIIIIIIKKNIELCLLQILYGVTIMYWQVAYTKSYMPLVN